MPKGEPSGKGSALKRFGDPVVIALSGGLVVLFMALSLIDIDGVSGAIGTKET
ncbi:MAG: hypothetical protein GVY36_13365 [Verrucomicrobia bacterium]|jgi:hypothetical protein|nr:hypothetical protein [Verrucomicrobiota bacterium]